MCTLVHCSELDIEPEEEEDEEAIIARRRQEREKMLARLQQQVITEDSQQGTATPASSSDKSGISSPDSDAVGEEAAASFRDEPQFDFAESVQMKRKSTASDGDAREGEDDGKTKKSFANGLDMFSEDMFNEDYNVSIKMHPGLLNLLMF